MPIRKPVFPVPGGYQQLAPTDQIVVDAAAMTTTVIGTGGVARPVYATVRERGIPITALGVTEDGVIDTAWTNAVAARANVLANYGRSDPLLLPAGIFKTNTGLAYDNSAATEPGGIHLEFIGSGSGLTTIVDMPSTGKFFSYSSSTDGDKTHSLMKIKGMQVLAQGGGIRQCFYADKAAFGFFQDVLTFGYDIHWNLTDCLSSKWIDCRWSGGRRGMWAQKSSFSYPNAFTLIGCHMGSCAEWGAVIDGGSLFTMVGGSVEGNGLGTSYSSRGGVAINRPCNEGMLAGSFLGVYFEGNAGLSHVLVDHSGASRPALINIASSFNLVSQGSKPAYVVWGKAGSGDPSLLLNVSGSGFGHYNDYIPTAGAPYLFAQGQARFVGTDQALYQAAIQAPNGVRGAFASCVFDGTVTSPLNGYGDDFISNVTSITKNGTGDFTLNFRAAGKSPYAVSALYLSPLTMLPPIVFSEAAQTLRLQFRNVAGTLTDPNVRLRIDC